jgi:hypothetical protein
MIRTKSLAAASLALILLAACGSSGIGDILGGGSNNSNYEIRGTVDSVDTASRSIYLTNVSGYNSSMLSSGGSSVRVYYDDQTTVSYNGKTYRPQDLERGDQISANVGESGNNLVADSVTVLQDVNTNGGTSSGVYGSSLTGTVRSVDTSRRMIEVDRGYGSTVWVEYETNTPVYFNNQTYHAADLERGDQIDVRFTDLGSGRYRANDITVTRSINGNSTNPSSNLSTVRGTVRYVDTSRRTIELESASWISGFTTGGTTGSRIIVQYDANSTVDVSGRSYPISGLERGDVVEVQVANASSSTPFAQRIFLVRDVNDQLR